MRAQKRGKEKKTGKYKVVVQTKYGKGKEKMEKKIEEKKKLFVGK